jgi:hypothetical protein
MPAPIARFFRHPVVPAAKPAGASVPHCIIVTGPRHAGKVSWLQETIHAVRADQPSARCAVLIAEEGVTEMERFAQAVPGVTVHRFFLPCQCCPAAADLPRHARALAEASGADWLFVALPVLPATGLIAEFDALVHWPREVVVCLDADWSEARRTRTLSFFQFQLVSAADRVIETRAQPVFDYPSSRQHELRCDPAAVLTLA